MVHLTVIFVFIKIVFIITFFMFFDGTFDCDFRLYLNRLYDQSLHGLDGIFDYVFFLCQQLWCP